jgi:hypothetical protein
MRYGVLLIVIPGLLACSEDKGPEQVIRAAYRLGEFARQNDFGSVQGELYELLSADSRALADECGGALAERPGADKKGAGAACLVFAGFDGTRGDLELKRLAAGTSRVRMEVKSGDIVRHVELVQEDGWKIDLAATAELNRASSLSP